MNLTTWMNASDGPARYQSTAIRPMRMIKTQNTPSLIALHGRPFSMTLSSSPPSPCPPAPTSNRPNLQPDRLRSCSGQPCTGTSTKTLPVLPQSPQNPHSPQKQGGLRQIGESRSNGKAYSRARTHCRSWSEWVLSQVRILVSVLIRTSETLQAGQSCLSVEELSGNLTLEYSFSHSHPCHSLPTRPRHHTRPGQHPPSEEAVLLHGGNWVQSCRTKVQQQASPLLVDLSILAAICQHTTHLRQYSSRSRTIYDTQSGRSLLDKARHSIHATYLAWTNGSLFESPAYRPNQCRFLVQSMAVCLQPYLATLAAHLSQRYPLWRASQTVHRTSTYCISG